MVIHNMKDLLSLYHPNEIKGTGLYWSITDAYFLLNSFPHISLGLKMTGMVTESGQVVQSSFCIPRCGREGATPIPSNGGEQRFILPIVRFFFFKHKGDYTEKFEKKKKGEIVVLMKC